MSLSAAQVALWLLVLLPAVGGAALVMLRAERVAVPVSLATAGVTTVLSLLVAWRRPAVSVPFLAGSDLALGVDTLSALMVPTVAAVTVAVLVFSAGEIRQSRARFHGLMLIFASSALLTATAQTLPALLFAWEVMGATSFALIGFWWREQHRVSAGVTAFVTTRAADLGLYLAAAAALAGGAGLALVDLPAADERWRDVVAAGVLLAALGKAAQLPFSFWLSGAMEGPSPVSALLHSAAMVAMGGYLLLRTEPLLAATGWAAPTASWAGAVTALLLGVVALAQQDLKQLLAASTSAQLGFVVMGAGLASVSGGAAHLVAHAATKSLLFLAAGAWLTALGTRHVGGLRGVARRWPLAGVASTIGLLSLAGVAPLALWATKDAVLAAALAQSRWLYAVGLAAAALSAAYAGKVLVVLWRPVTPAERPQVAARRGVEGEGTGEVEALAQAPMVVLALGALLLGVLALPPVGDTLARALGEQPLHPTPWEMLLSAGLALAVLALVWRWRAPQPSWARGWLGLEPAARTLVVRPTLAASEMLARFDDLVLDRVVTQAATSTLAMARRVARFDDEVLDGAVESGARATMHAARGADRADEVWVDGAVRQLAAAARQVGRSARRPQSGQLQHYYVQAVGVLAVAVLLLLVVR